MGMDFTVIERLVLLNSVLPARGDATTLKLVRKMRENLSFDEEEHAKLNFRQEGDNLIWDTTDLVKDVEVGPKAKTILMGALEAKDKAKDLDAATLDLYERFVEEKDTTE